MLLVPSFLAYMPGPFEWMIIAGVGLLIFGKRLPEVGRGLGRSIVEFKKGLRDVGAEIDDAAEAQPKPVLPNEAAASPRKVIE